MLVSNKIWWKALDLIACPYKFISQRTSLIFCLFSKEYDPSNTTIILGFLNKVNVFLACSKIERYGHFWPRRHHNFPITQLCTQPKFLHKEVKIPTWGWVLAWGKLVTAGPGIRVQGTPHLTPHPESVQPTCRLLTSTRWVDSPTFPYALYRI